MAFGLQKTYRVLGPNDLVIIGRARFGPEPLGTVSPELDHMAAKHGLRPLTAAKRSQHRPRGHVGDHQSVQRCKNM
jgi:hypothetical protein